MVDQSSADKFTDLRQRAEALLQHTTPIPDDISADRFLRLLHELEVYQIELEMQNEELRRTQIELEESRRQYKDLYDFSPVGYFTVDVSYLIVEANLTGATLLGTERIFLNKRPFTHFVFPPDQDTFYFFHRQLYLTQTQGSCELRLVRSDGSQFYAGLEGVVARDPLKNVDRCRITVSDISWRKQAEAQLKEYSEQLERLVTQRTASLQGSEARYRSLFQDSPFPLLEVDLSEIKRNIDHLKASGVQDLAVFFETYPNVMAQYARIMRVRNANSAARALFDSAELDVITGETPQAETSQIFDVIRPGIAALAEGKTRSEGEIVRQTRAKGSVYLIASLSLPAGSETSWSQVIVSMIDITERKKSEQALRDAFAKVMETSDLKSKFLATASHEFRTPLAIINSAAGILRLYNHRLAPEKKEQYFSQIDAQIWRMTGLLEDMLTISRGEAGQLELDPVVVDVVELFTETLDEIRLAVGSTHTLNFSSNTDHAVLRVDSRYLRLIISNLVSNAVKFSTPGGVITIDLNAAEDRMIFAIRDEGIGIPEKDRASIFEPFRRGENVRGIKGTGLGLAIVKQYVEKHGGQITFESQEGRGTTFTVMLPAVQLREPTG